ncbi:MAG: hypothetical protein UX26_C0016G0006 [Parcubacteria group bacterium GW2011_GWC1_45_9]|nr:MAG: hypothetical protein UW89_C0008G0007 [Parcubacteria group bacterium GW2011_GWB1_45_10]KKU16787.1 MAG: hypothetical protein UX26_C0016G0006 [Parcubacteria group bacterium GW2011_GWC1_45_9]
MKKIYLAAFVLIVLTVVLAACANNQTPAVQAQLAPGNPDYDRIYQLGLSAGQAMAPTPIPALCPAVDIVACQSYVSQALSQVVYDKTTCAQVLDESLAAWSSGLVSVCSGAGYAPMNHDTAMAFVQAEGYQCYIPQTVTPRPPKKDPECSGNCEPVEPPCEDCTIITNPGD